MTEFILQMDLEPPGRIYSDAKGNDRGIMGTLIEEYDQERRTVLKARWLMTAVVAALIGEFLTAPLGVIWLVNGDGLGWLLVLAGALLTAAAALLFAASRRLVPADDFYITADASQQPDPQGTPIWARKEVGWTVKAFRLWS